MRCPNCGSEYPPGAQFCGSCGNSLETSPKDVASPLYCSSCGIENPPHALACASCGAPIGVSQGTNWATDSLQVEVSVEYMGFWIRVLAAAIDWVILTVVFLLLVAITDGLNTLVQWLIDALYFVIFTGLRGQTPGKRVVGIQVLTKSGEVPGLGRAFLREVIGKFISGIVLLLGYIWVGFDAHKQGWHDKIASTYVIRKR